MYCPQHLLRVPTLPCRNTIVRFLCCLKVEFAYELCWQTTKQYQSHKIVLSSLQAMFNMLWWTEICQFVVQSHVGLGDCAVCSARLRSRRFRWFEQILDVLCPASSPLYILFGNSFIIRVEPQPLWVRRLQIRLRSSAFKRPITIKAINQ